MKHLNFIALLCILQSCNAPAQRDTISREMLVGTWIEYTIEDNAKYLSIPDSIKNHDTVDYPVSSFISNIYEIHADGTYGFFVGLMDVEIGWTGTWSVRNDTLVLTEDGKPELSYLPMRRIADGKIEVAQSGLYDGKMQTSYWYLEKSP